MRAGAIVTAVLGLGTVLVFVAAAMTATLFPNGTMVNANLNGGIRMGGGWMKGGGIAVPVPMPVPVNGIDPTLIDPAPDVTDPPADTLPVVVDAGGAEAAPGVTAAP
jgi:hypothetical protein